MHSEPLIPSIGSARRPDLLLPYYSLQLCCYKYNTIQALAHAPHLLLVRLLHTSPRGQHDNTIITYCHLALTP